MEARTRHPTWKFTFPDRIMYLERNRAAMGFYWRNRDVHSFKIEVRSQKGGWDFVTHIVPSDTCKCGRSYEIENGELFKFQPELLIATIAEMTKIMLSPVLCQICYYKGELEAGRWAPKNVKRELGLES